jgi:hypothetical protein
MHQEKSGNSGRNFCCEDETESALRCSEQILLGGKSGSDVALSSNVKISQDFKDGIRR